MAASQVITVIECFDLYIPPDEYDHRTISITGPRLTYGGMQALNDLIAEYGTQGTPDEPPPDETV
jgi:hypothetical protein